MVNHDIVVIGASAGGVETLTELVSKLPAALPAAVFVVLHLSPTAESNLASILNRAGAIPVVSAEDGVAFEHNRIYVAVRDRHLLLEEDRIILVRGPKENRHRPAIDPLFRSAALAYGPRVIGVVLSGLLDDGTIGLWQIKQMGGIAVVQDPKDARCGGMPQNALDNVDVDHCEPLERLGPLLVRLVKSTAPEAPKRRPSNVMKVEQRYAKMEDTKQDIKKVGTPSQYVCPECGGTLFKLSDGRLARYRCRVGHGYGEESLVEEQSEHAEAALWEGMRALREKSDLLRQRAAELANGSPRRDQLLELSKLASEQANDVKGIVERNQMPPNSNGEP